MSAEPWDLCHSPSKYYEFNWDSDDAPARKFYLFIAELGRRLRPHMTDPGPVEMIDLCERCAEGEITEDDLADLSDDHQPDNEAYDGSFVTRAANNLYWYVADRYKVNSRGVHIASVIPAVLAATEAGLLPPAARYEVIQGVTEHPLFALVKERTQREWGDLVRCIYGPDPFRPVAFDPAWRSDTAVALARGMYDARHFGPMPVLADALEDAGCDQPDLLAHCRDRHGVHVRGCWAVDLVLGKS